MLHNKFGDVLQSVGVCVNLIGDMGRTTVCLCGRKPVHCTLQLEMATANPDGLFGCMGG